TQLADQRLGVGSADRLQRPRENERLAGERTVAHNVDGLRLDARREQLLDELAARSTEVRVDLMRHVRADTLDPLQLLLGRVAQVVDGPEIAREQLRGCVADRGDAECVEKSTQVRAPACG